MVERDNFKLHPADYVVTALTLIIPLAIGIGFAIKDAKRATRDEYLLGGGRMSMLPVAMSIFITFQSAISMIGIPSEVFTYGPMFLIFGIGLSLSYVIGLWTTVPLFYPLRLTSIYEYLYHRYNSSAVRMLSTLIGMLTTVFYMAIALYAPALALQSSANIPLWLSIVIVGIIGTFYTAIGGIKSVIWTDAFQTVLTFVGIFAIIGKGVVLVGGATEVWEIAKAGGRTTLDRVDPDIRIRHTFQSLIVGGCFMWLVNSYNQATIQRISSMKSQKAAKQAFMLNIPFTLLWIGTLVSVGVVVYAYIVHDQCDPYEAKIIDNRNQLVPYFVLRAFEDLPGMAGLFLGSLFCGSLSTLSSGINALAANTVKDVLGHPLRFVSETRATTITKIFAGLYGGVIIGLSYGAQYLKGPVTQMGATIFGCFGSPILGIFLIGATIPWANKFGALVGIIAATTFNVWINIGHLLHGYKTEKLPPVTTAACFNETFISRTSLSLTNITAQSLSNDSSDSFGFFLYDISYEWYSVTGSVISVSLCFVVSLLTRSCFKDKSFPDSKYIFPFMRKVWSMSEPDWGDKSKTVNNKGEIECVYFSEMKGLNIEGYVR